MSFVTRPSERSEEMNGFIREEDLEEIRERNNIVEVVSEYVTLKKAGKSFKALCPFHQEKTPSFMVDPVKQLYHCFGCGEGGSVFTFVMKMDKLDFPETVKHLADRVGYQLTLERSRGTQEKTSLKSRFYEAHKEASLFYHQFLKTDEGKEAQAYLKKRGFNQETVDYFKIGLAPSSWDSLFKFLSKKGYKAGELEQAGLVIKGEAGSFYDRFRARLIFPIFDLKERVIAFGGRALKNEEPKYLNSPETPLYHKSSILYGLYQAKGEAIRVGEVLIVEGYTDALALYQAGIRNVVATMGTAFTGEHLHLLSRFVPRVKLIFDADQAGKQAMERGLELLGETKAEILVVTLPSGEDPADFVFKKGKESLQRVSEKAPLLVDFCLSEVLSRYDLGDVHNRIKAASEALPIIASLKNALAQEEYLKKLSERLGFSLDALLVELKKLKGGPKNFLRKKEVLDPLGFERMDAQFKAEKELIQLALHFPKEAFRLENLEENHFTWPEYKELLLILKNKLLQEGKIETKKLITSLAGKDQKVLSKLLLEEVTIKDQQIREKYWQDLILKLKEFYLERQISNLRKELEKIDPNEAGKEYDAFFEKILGLEETKRNLKNLVLNEGD